MRWCSISLVNNSIHIYILFPPQCRNELHPHECNVTVCVHRYPILIFVLKEKWPDDAISSDGTPQIHFLLAKRAMGRFMGLNLIPEAHILLVDVPTQVTVSLITKENQIQEVRVIFSPLTDIFAKCFLFCFIVYLFHLFIYLFIYLLIYSFSYNHIYRWSTMLAVTNKNQ